MGIAHFAEAQGLVKGVGGRIGRIGIDLADDDVMTVFGCESKQVVVKQPRQAPATMARVDGDGVDIDEAVEPAPEPQEVGAVVVGILLSNLPWRGAARLLVSH